MLAEPDESYNSWRQQASKGLRSRWKKAQRQRTLPRLELLGGTVRFEADDVRGAAPIAAADGPTAGDMERMGTLGGGPGSAPGERRCTRGGPWACMAISGSLKRWTMGER